MAPTATAALDAPMDLSTKARRKLRLEEFLRQNLDEAPAGRVIQWVRREEGVFRILWTHQSSGAFTHDDAALFRYWALARGKEPSLSSVELKQSLRMALNKSPSVQRLAAPQDEYRYFRFTEWGNRGSRDVSGSGRKLHDHNEASRKRTVPPTTSDLPPSPLLSLPHVKQEAMISDHECNQSTRPSSPCCGILNTPLGYDPTMTPNSENSKTAYWCWGRPDDSREQTPPLGKRTTDASPHHRPHAPPPVHQQQQLSYPWLARVEGGDYHDIHPASSHWYRPENQWHDLSLKRHVPATPGTLVLPTYEPLNMLRLGERCTAAQSVSLESRETLHSVPSPYDAYKTDASEAQLSLYGDSRLNHSSLYDLRSYDQPVATTIIDDRPLFLPTSEQDATYTCFSTKAEQHTTYPYFSIPY